LPFEREKSSSIHLVTITYLYIYISVTDTFKALAALTLIKLNCTNNKCKDSLDPRSCINTLAKDQAFHKCLVRAS